MSDQSLRDALEQKLATTDGWAVSNEFLLGLLAAHPAEPAPVVTDEAVEAAAMAVSLDWENYTASMRTALKAAAPLLGPRPLLDENEVSSWIVEAAVQFAGSSGSTDACHDAVKPALDGVMKLARPMPTREQIEAAVRKTIFAYFGTYERPVELITDDVTALLNGAES